MRNAKMKKVTIALFACCALSCATLGGTLFSAEAETVTPTIASVSRINVVDGADLYLYSGSETDKDYNGMRFRFEMSTDLYELIVNEDRTGFKGNNEFSAMVVPTYLLNTTEAATTADVVNSPYTYTEVLSFDKWTLDTGLTSTANEDENGQVYYACAYLYNMPFYTYNVEYSACLCFVSGASISYTNTVTRSMTTTAENAIASGDWANDATTTDKLNEYSVAENEINNFDFSNSLEFSGRNIWQRTRQSYADKSVWHDEFQGRTGVAQFSESGINANSATTVSINFAPRQLKSAYEGYTHIVFSMYIDDPNNIVEWFNFAGNGSVTAQISGSEIVRGDWKEYALPIDTFINNYDNFLQSSDSSYLAIRRKKGKPTALNIFIDSIYVAAMAPTVQFETTLADQGVGEEFVLPTATVENAKTVEYTLFTPNGSETVTAGQAYTATVAGEYTLRALVTGVDGSQVSASFTFNVVESTGKVEINNYSTQEKVTGATTANSNTTTGYLSDYQGKMGVMSVTIKAGSSNKTVWGQVYWNPQNDLSAIPADHNYIVVTVWVDANLSLIDFTQIGNDTNVWRYWTVSSGTANSNGAQIIAGAWNDIYVPISVFKDNYDDIIGKATSAANINFRNNGSETTVYIDEIYTVKLDTAPAMLSADVEETETFENGASEAMDVLGSVVTAGADKRSLVYNV